MQSASATPTQSIALLILRQSGAVDNASAEKRKDADLIVASANSIGGTVRSVKQPTRAASTISDSMFSVNHVNVTKLKLELIERTGKALGVVKEDYAAADEFASALRRAVSRFKFLGGPTAVMALERELGLTRLGVTLDDVVNSAGDPDANDKLTKALEKQAGKIGDKDQTSGALLLHTDEIGLYRIGTPLPPG